MKKQFSLLLAMVLMFGFSAIAGNVTKEKFKVYGNCGMCEKTIEKAVKNVDGVKKANWNQKTKMMEITFDAEKTNIEAIHQAIADVGYDTENATAKDEVYEALHSCCKYDRPER
ncbi:ATPase [Lentimicrobium sp. L6]|uniref:heavy-metal-associated domain-containing protein n=1 Tax=Lentimicrobium sp. L6 TaxID=2735916 RepID=UPI0015571ECB|nr:cation transporter [Lentimicrobium sp. L6]NPD84621.1 ATPase [Lentimicrobium sp. L6]